jgi:hypothetical protein
MLILSILQLYYKYITNILLAAAIRREPLGAVQRKSLLRSLRRRRITRAALLVGELRGEESRNTRTRARAYWFPLKEFHC